jgi:hypothetical protein
VCERIVHKARNAPRVQFEDDRPEEGIETKGHGMADHFSMEMDRQRKNVKLVIRFARNRSNPSKEPPFIVPANPIAAWSKSYNLIGMTAEFYRSVSNGLHHPLVFCFKLSTIHNVENNEILSGLSQSHRPHHFS